MATPKEKLGNAAFAVFRPGKYMQAKADQQAADENAANAERLRQESLDLARQLDWEPEKVSDAMAPYQRTESPLARSYLESLLTGANPSMVSSTRLGADRLRAGAQAAFDKQTGGYDALLARQREVENQAPWAPNEDSTAKIISSPGLTQASADDWGSVGGQLTPEEAWYPDEYLERLKAAGIKTNPRTGKPF